VPGQIGRFLFSRQAVTGPCPGPVVSPLFPTARVGSLPPLVGAFEDTPGCFQLRLVHRSSSDWPSAGEVPPFPPFFLPRKKCACPLFPTMDDDPPPPLLFFRDRTVRWCTPPRPLPWPEEDFFPPGGSSSPGLCLGAGEFFFVCVVAFFLRGGTPWFPFKPLGGTKRSFFPLPTTLFWSIPLSFTPCVVFVPYQWQHVPFLFRGHNPGVAFPPFFN